MTEVERGDSSVVSADTSDDAVNVVIAGRRWIDQLTTDAGWHQRPMLEQRCLLNGAEDVAALDARPRLELGDEGPSPRAV